MIPRLASQATLRDVDIATAMEPVCVSGGARGGKKEPACAAGPNIYGFFYYAANIRFG
ncbi:MAG: hypothetical protein O7C03_04925 [Gammaproteobacteria bacterium]|nr:hypothetical protein [Gammaproteobacteria bacterium]